MAKQPLTLDQVLGEHEERVQGEQNARDEELNQARERRAKRQNLNLDDVLNEYPKPDAGPGPENVDESVLNARMLHLKEGVRRWHKDYDKERELLDQVPPEVVAQHAALATEMQNKKGNTVKDHAAIDAYIRQNFQADMTPQPEWYAGSLKGLGALGNALDWSHRTLVRTPGWRFHTSSWSEAYDMSKHGWSDDLMRSGLPYWGALLIGIPLEGITEPAMLAGAGAGLKHIPGEMAQKLGKQLAEKALGEIGEKAIKELGEEGLEKLAKEYAEKMAKQGIRQTGDPAQIGLHHRKWFGKDKGKRVLTGIPGTERAGALIADLGQRISKKFVAGGGPMGDILRGIHKGISDDEVAMVSYAMRDAWRPSGDKIAKLKLEPEAFQRAWAASEYVSHYRNGEEWAVDAVKKITNENKAEIEAAELIRDGFTDVADVVNSANLKFPDPLEPIAKKQKNVNEAIADVEKKILKREKVTFRSVRELSAAQELVQKTVEKGQKAASAVGEMADVFAKSEQRQLDKLLSGQPEEATSEALERLSKTVSSGKTEKLSAQLDEALGEVPALTGRQASSEYQGKLAKEVGDLPVLLKNILGQKTTTGIAKGRATLKIAQKRIASLVDEIKVARKQAMRDALTPEQAYQVSRSYYNAAEIGKKVREIHKMHPAEWEQAVRKTLNLKNYKKMMTEGQWSRVSKLQTRLDSIYKDYSKAVNKRLRLQEFAEGKLAKSQALDLIKKHDNLLEKAAKLDEAAARTPDYIPRTSEFFRDEATARIHKTLPSNPNPLGDSGAMIARQWFDPDTGRQLYIQEVEEHYRRGVRLLSDELSGKQVIGQDMVWMDKKVGDTTIRGRLTKDLESMFGETDITKALKKAQKLKAEGKYIYSASVEMNPAIAFLQHTGRIMQDVQGAATIRGLGALASDVKDAAHPVSARSIGGRIADEYSSSKTIRDMVDVFKKKYPKKQFPDEVVEKLSAKYAGSYDPEDMISKLVKEFPDLQDEFGEGVIRMKNAASRRLNERKLIASGKPIPRRMEMPLSMAGQPLSKEADEIAGMVTNLRKMFPDKHFPREVETELAEWTSRYVSNLKSKISTKNVALKGYDAALGGWKLFSTGLWPSFHFRNAISDTIRAMTNGLFSPGDMYNYGIKAVRKADELIELKGFGKITGAQLWDLGKSYKVNGGYFDEIVGSAKALAPKWQKSMRLLSLGEDIRRVGYFAVRINQGFSPLEAARDTLKVFFDYKNLAPWEKTMAKRIWPWWAFQRNNLRFQIDKLISQPYFAAAHFKTLKGREHVSKMSEKYGEDDWYPDWMKGRGGILMSEGGVTSIMYGWDMGGVNDIADMVDSYGHPRGVFATFLKNSVEGMAPIGELVGKEIIGRMTGDINKMVSAPRGAENLPETLKSWLGIIKEEKNILGGRKQVDVWMMPKGALDKAKALRLWSESMKFMRYTKTRTLTENRIGAAIHFLSGLSKRQITNKQIREMIYRERMAEMTRDGLKKGWLDKYYRVIPSKRKKKWSREYGDSRDKWIKALHKRQLEDDRMRFKPEESNVQD